MNDLESMNATTNDLLCTSEGSPHTDPGASRPRAAASLSASDWILRTPAACSLWLILAACGGAPGSEQEDVAGSSAALAGASPGPNGRTPITTIALGDSNTYGWYLERGDPAVGTIEGYRYQLDQNMQSVGYDLIYQGQIADNRRPGYANNLHEGLPSWSLANILNGAWGYQPMVVVDYNQPQALLLMAGTNDIIQATEHKLDSSATVWDLENTMRATLDHVKYASSNTIVVVATIFPFVVHTAWPPGIPDTAGDQNSIVLEFNDWLRNEVAFRASQQKIALADMYNPADPVNTLNFSDITDDGAETWQPNGRLVGIGVHATVTGYYKCAAVWTRALYDYLATH